MGTGRQVAALGEAVPHQTRVVAPQARVRHRDGANGCPEVAVEAVMPVDEALELQHNPPTSLILIHSNRRLPRSRLVRQRRGWEPDQRLGRPARQL